MPPISGNSKTMIKDSITLTTPNTYDTNHFMDDIPEWLRPTDDEVLSTKFPTTSAHREIQRIAYESIFERVLEGAMEGESIKSLVKTDPRNVSYGQFMAWVERNPERLKQYEQAKKIGTHAVLEDMKDISDGNGLEDVNRSKLRIDVRKIELQSWNKERYGNEKDAANTFGAGGITIVISEVKSPYLDNKVIDGESTRV